MSVYKTGTLTLVAGNIVVGAGTAFMANVKAGDTLHYGGASEIVRSVETNLACTLESAWAGPTGSGLSGWKINHTGDGWSSNVQLAETAVRIIQGIEAGFPYKADSTGTLAERAAFDAKPKGWTFLRTDVTPFLLYAKTADAIAAWSAGSDSLLENDRAAAADAAGSAARSAAAASLDRTGTGQDRAAVAADRVLVDAAAGAGLTYRDAAADRAAEAAVHANQAATHVAILAAAADDWDLADPTDNDDWDA